MARDKNTFIVQRLPNGKLGPSSIEGSKSVNRLPLSDWF
jgi:hypothetical protein